MPTGDLAAIAVTVLVSGLVSVAVWLLIRFAPREAECVVDIDRDGTVTLRWPTLTLAAARAEPQLYAALAFGATLAVRVVSSYTRQGAAGLLFLWAAPVLILGALYVLGLTVGFTVAVADMQGITTSFWVGGRRLITLQALPWSRIASMGMGRRYGVRFIECVVLPSEDPLLRGEIPLPGYPHDDKWALGLGLSAFGAKRALQSIETLRSSRVGVASPAPSWHPEVPADERSSTDRSGLAVAAGYLGLLSVLVIPAPFALGTALAAIRDLRRNPSKRGWGWAVFGLTAGGSVTFIVCLVLLALVLT